MIKDVVYYGADITGTNDSSSAFTTCALNENYVIVPEGVYIINNIDLSDHTIIFNPSSKVINSGTTTINIGYILSNETSYILDGDFVCENSKIYPEWYGASGSSEIIDTLAMNRCCKNTNATVCLLSKTPYLFTSISLENPIIIEGRKNRSSITHKGSTDLFNIKSNDVTICNLWINDSTIPSSNIFIFNHDTTNGSYQRHEIENVISYGSKGFAKDTGTGSLVTINYRKCVAKKHKGIGFKFSRVFGYLHFNNVTVDFVGSDSPSWNAWNIKDNQGVMFEDCDVTGSSGAGTGATSSQAGFVLNNCAGVWFRKTQADTLEGRGYELIDCSGVQFYDGISSLCAGVGFYFRNCSNVTGAIRSVGRKDLPYYVSGICGVAFEGNNSVFRIDVQSNSNTLDAVNVAGNFTGICISSLQCFNNTGKGLNVVGTGSLLVGTASLGSNYNGNYSLSSSLQGVGFSQLNSGVFRYNMIGNVTL